MRGQVSPAEAEVVVVPRGQKAAASRLALVKLSKPWAVASRHRTSLASLMTVPEGYVTLEDLRQNQTFSSIVGRLFARPSQASSFSGLVIQLQPNEVLPVLRHRTKRQKEKEHRKARP